MRWQYSAILVPVCKHKSCCLRTTKILFQSCLLLFLNNKNSSFSLYSFFSCSLFFNIFRFQSLSLCTLFIFLHCSPQVPVLVVAIKISSVFVAFQFSNNLVSDIFSAAVENYIFALIRFSFMIHHCFCHS